MGSFPQSLLLSCFSMQWPDVEMLEQSFLVLVLLLLLLLEAATLCPIVVCHCVWLCNIPLMAAILPSMIVSLLSNLELPLVEFGGIDSPTLYSKVCSAHKDKVEISA
jgi:hypothetical protein